MKTHKRKMSPKSMANLKKIQKGQVLNPLGAGAHNPLLRTMRKFSQKYFAEVIDMAVMGNLEGLASIINDPKSEAIKVGVAKSLFNAIADGDWDVLDRIVSRLIGKVPDKINITTEDLSDEELDAKIKQLEAEQNEQAT